MLQRLAKYFFESGMFFCPAEKTPRREKGVKQDGVLHGSLLKTILESVCLSHSESRPGHFKSSMLLCRDFSI